MFSMEMDTQKGRFHIGITSTLPSSYANFELFLASREKCQANEFRPSILFERPSFKNRYGSHHPLLINSIPTTPKAKTVKTAKPSLFISPSVYLIYHVTWSGQGAWAWGKAGGHPERRSLRWSVSRNQTAYGETVSNHFMYNRNR